MAENPKFLQLLNEIAAKEKLQNHDIKVKPVSSGGSNYTSQLFTIIISSEHREDLHLFAKVAAFGEKMRSEMPMNIFNTERFIYTELKDTFRHLEEKYAVEEKDRFQISAFYGANTNPGEEIIVFEDLMAKGFTTYDRMKSITWEYGAAVCTELAKLHSLAMAYEKESPDKFAHTLKLLHFDFLEASKGMEAFWQGAKNTALGAVRDENRERFKKFLQDTELSTFNNGFLPKRKKVLIHGDFRCSNIMHRNRHDGSVEVIPVDYQTIRAGCPVSDLYYFIFSGTDAQFRAKYYDQLISHYYTELRAALTRLGMDPEEVYSQEDFKYELKENVQFALTVAIFGLPLITVEVEDAPKLDDGLEMSDFAVKKTSSLYAERLNGIVDDFVRWGVI